MTSFSVAPYSCQDFEPVVTLLNTCLPLESITPENFARRVLLDVNFDAQGARVAKDSDRNVVGFLLAMIRKRNLEDAPSDTDKGWITLFAVAPHVRKQGIGTRLLQQAEEWLRMQDRKTVLISPYAPGYWIPGVDESAYPEALTFLHRYGYVTAARPLSMQAELDGDWNCLEVVQAQSRQRQRSNESDWRVTPYAPKWTPLLTDFLRREFPGDWQRHVRETMQDILRGVRPADELWLASRGEESIVGFAQSEQERFGPIGVADSERGRGVGALLMTRTMAAMRARGLSRAWFLWTNDETADHFYRPAGFKDSRRFALLKKPL